ncbi:MAG: hypothetical protein J6328_01655 [Bacilli bacterium]|nr:hypothetical protein [Bacilli bacterium]
MKRNDFAVFIVYVGILATAVLVGLLVLRPLLLAWDNEFKILVAIAAVLGGALFNALLIEVGHFLGAKAGHYDVYAWCILGLGVKKDAEGKKKFGFMNHDGLTGDTKITPKDLEKSTASGLILIPLILFLAEVIGGMVMIAFSDRGVKVDGNPNAVWMKVVAVTVMTIGGMIYLYNYFPAHLDNVTDGYRMILLSKPINKEAYNRHLQNEYRAAMGLPLPPIPVYDDVTDYTAAVNMDKVYQLLRAGKYGEAILVVQKTLDTEERVSESTANEAMAMKLSLVLLTTRRDGGLTYYEENVENPQRKYLATLPDASALRAYLLVAGVLEGSETETNYALERAPKIMRRVPDSKKDVENKLLSLTLQRIKTLHPTWTLKNVEEKPAEEAK